MSVKSNAQYIMMEI